MHDEVAAYVLGVLDEEEHEAFERHLDECEQCRRELVELVELPEQLDELKHTPSASDDDPPMSMSR
ncbi:zf-HC2 domain-containing protein [Nonomuraea wenchangensis]|jgi:anti-sigma factor RsiW|uniref:Zf-HC2 domain-containing protein n=2 Tax=Nonomuraea TaxID=83681 RepID=A0ABV3H324_9ACTN|nr:MULTISPECIES: zf-HC2 domain-containing protein [Nonomuraea]MED7927250.1 zf-HC2 domain-containing protein [Nonomuraea sp. LP-02]SET55883.1 Putative zinc-finger [Nonomuraea wenchangensis]